jgi:Helix-turn-helix domain
MQPVRISSVSMSMKLEPSDDRLLVTMTVAELRQLIGEEVSAALQNEAGHVVDKDKLLTPQEAAEILGQTVRWVYRHAKQWTFAKRLSRKCLRFPENALRRYAMARNR